MKAIKLMSAAALVFASTFAFAENRNAETTNVPNATSSETKTQAILYWFDANTGQYIGHIEDSGCDGSTLEPCAVGYTNVANPSNPQQPSTAPQQTEFGKR